MITIAVRNTGHISTEKLEYYLAYLSVEEQTRIRNYHRIEDRQRALLGVLTVLYMFRQYYPNVEALKWYRRDKRGRPYVEASSVWQGDFNISHAGSWIVCTMTAKGKVGVDIEELRPLDVAVALACLTTKEYILLLQQTKADRWTFFYERWTRKEAIGKAIGTGLLTPVHLLASEANNNWAIRHYRIDETHIACVCASANELPGQVIYMKDVEIAQHWTV